MSDASSEFDPVTTTSDAYHTRLSSNASTSSNASSASSDSIDGTFMFSMRLLYVCSDFVAQSIIQLSTFIPSTMKPLLLKISDSCSPAILSLITGKSLTYNRQAFSLTTLTTTISFNHCRIDYIVLILTERTAPKSLNFVLPVPLVPMVAEQCGHSARTAGPSPWSTRTNAFHHATTEKEIDISIRVHRQPRLDIPT
jgi:hypothetical protein